MIDEIVAAQSAEIKRLRTAWYEREADLSNTIVTVHSAISTADSAEFTLLQLLEDATTEKFRYTRHLCTVCHRTECGGAEAHEDQFRVGRRE